MGRWIAPAEADPLREAHRPAYHLVGELRLPSEPVHAVLHATAHGLYEAFLNGQRVGDAELTPGSTAYRARLQVQTYDVTTMLRAGDNALGLLLSDGWWRGQATVTRKSNYYGDHVAALAELHVTLPSGDVVVFGTDESWRSTRSHILAADLMAGEHHDLRHRVLGWADPGTDRSGWDLVHPVDSGTHDLVPTTGPAVRRTEEIPAVSVREVRRGRHIVDFGRNSNGWIRLTDPGPVGTELVIQHGEALTPESDGVANQVHDGLGIVVQRDFPVPFQTDTVVSAGRDVPFEPRHSTKGFRYLQIDGHPGPLEPSALTSIVVRSDLTKVGAFRCSAEELNALHRAAEWSFLTNACDIPTDCPTRERAGWTGDWQIFVETAAFLYDVTDFSRKWLLDLAADQLESGAVTQFAPMPVDLGLERNQWFRATQGPAGWGDAVVHVPWEIYRATGRTDVLSEGVDAMRKWVDFAARAAASGRHPDRVAARPDAEPHESFIWDTGFHFGDWNEPREPGSEAPDLHATDHGPTATAFLYRSSDELSRIADALGMADTAERYRGLAEQVRAAWQREFMQDGRVELRTQANLVRALAFDLVPEGDRPQVTKDLVGLIRAADTHLGTGFLSTPFLLPVLADNGQLDLAYELLLQRTPPSWLAMIEAGATTIWEAWDSMLPDGTVTSSLNHFSMGAVISFLHRYTAGLQIDEPGYRQFRVQPRPGRGITSASTHHDSPHGRIAVSWSLTGGQGELALDVPPGTTANLVLPSARPELLPAGHHLRQWRA
jgi:alpha-L-rhamnosidase